MLEARPLILDEIDTAKGDLVFSIQALAAKEPVTLTSVNGFDGRPLVVQPWYNPQGEPEGEFILASTCNTRGRGDSSGSYSTRQIQDEAAINRWTTIELGYPPPEQEARILMARCGIASSLAQKIVDVARLAREALSKGKILAAVSVRNALKWARFVQVLGLKAGDAFDLAVLQGSETEDRQGLCEMFQRVFGCAPV
jgi:MoxR-like ATPase